MYWNSTVGRGLLHGLLAAAAAIALAAPLAWGAAAPMTLVGVVNVNTASAEELPTHPPGKNQIQRFSIYKGVTMSSI